MYNLKNTLFIKYAKNANKLAKKEGPIHNKRIIIIYKEDLEEKENIKKLKKLYHIKNKDLEKILITSPTKNSKEHLSREIEIINLEYDINKIEKIVKKLRKEKKLTKKFDKKITEKIKLIKEIIKHLKEKEKLQFHMNPSLNNTLNILKKKIQYEEKKEKHIKKIKEKIKKLSRKK